ncbi:MAG: hypothetical protein ACRDX8_11555 [Acidimicrobiales bacterium]
MQRIHAYDGSYDAARAAALSGVPISTVYDWARKSLVVPSIAPARPKLWSYADLMALRIVAWLRHPKEGLDDSFPASHMGEVRSALARLGEHGLDLWQSDSSQPSPLLVDRRGHIYVAEADNLVDSAGQQLLSGELLDLLAPFEGELFTGPDLRRPRPHLRIVPNKCAGEPHLCGSRTTTLTMSALASRGYHLGEICALYPEEDQTAIAEAIEFESSLDGAGRAA